MLNRQVSVNQVKIGVILATHDRVELYSKRAIFSILTQSQPPDYLIVVDDSNLESNREENERYINSLESDITCISITKNRRTHGACGAWNTGIDWIFANTKVPESTYIAILDGDDSWHPNYLETCVNKCIRGKLDMVVSGINRLELENTQPLIYPAPVKLEVEDFLVKNDGIQGSNIFIRMSTILMAGCFDESLQSLMVRDICIRIADIGEVNYAPIDNILVNHFPNLNRLRLTTKASEAKLSGLTNFWQKYYGRMNEEQKLGFNKRAKHLFSWNAPIESTQLGKKSNFSSYITPWIAPPPSTRSPFTLIIGVITSEPETIQPLLQSLSSENLSIKIMILDNGCPSNKLEEIAEESTKIGLDISIIDRDQQKIDASRGIFGQPYKSRSSGQVGIAQARTMIQRYLAYEMADNPEAIGWILDDDMRIDRRATSYVHWLPILREANIDVVLGAYEGSSPNPPFNGLRVQLVDLVHNLNWLSRIEPTKLLPDRSDENKVARINCPDYYYDLSRKHTSHLENPHWIESVIDNETVLDARTRLLEGANNLISGHPITRPLVVNTPFDPLTETKNSVNRGGNTFILNYKTLSQTPNSIFHVDGQEARRSDMMWAIVNRYMYGFVIKSVNFPVTHTVRESSLTELNISKLKSEIIGSALYAGLTDFLSINTTHTLNFSKKDLSEIKYLIEQNLSDRMIQIEMSFYRIRGLHLTLKNNFNEPLIQPLIGQLENLFCHEVWLELCDELSKHKISETIEFLSEVRELAEEYASMQYVDDSFINN
jgi:glycosyltransferase involved in cell wall biosynthesis